MRKTSISPSTRELEATLLIFAETPKPIIDKLDSLQVIGNHRLTPQESRTMHDHYLDTPDGQLEHRQMALRIREMEPMIWMTLKGPARSTGWGAVERLEIEELWSKNALTGVIEALRANGIATSLQEPDGHPAAPLKCMRTMGFQVIQDRETLRRVKNVMASEEAEGPEVAEMVIDSVQYHFDGQTVCHHEIEIEAKSKCGVAVVKDVSESLMCLFGSSLRIWNYGKLVTGKMIERMIRGGVLDELIDADRNLLPRAYQKMEGFHECADIR